MATAAAAQWTLPVLAVSAAAPGVWPQPATWAFGALGFAIGVRWMAVHQLHDLDSDRRGDVRTYAATGGRIWPVIVAAFGLEVAALALVLLVSWPLSWPALAALGCWGLCRALLRYPQRAFRTRLQGYEEAPLAEYYFLMLPLALALARLSSSSGFMVIVAVLVLLGAPHLQRMLREWQMSARLSRARLSRS
jgi:hypothetical protein